MEIATITLAPHYEGPWGIWDTTDKLWLGDVKGDGPKTCTAKLHAQFIATLTNEQFHHSVRFRIKPMDKGPFRLKDTLTAKMTRGEALDRLTSRA